MTCVRTGIALFWISVHDYIRNLRHDLLDQSTGQHGHSVVIILSAHRHTQTYTDTNNQIPGCLSVFVEFQDVCVCLFYLHLLLGYAAGSSHPNNQWCWYSAGA